MKLPPLALGVAAGLTLTLLLAPVTGTALGRLAAARAEHARLTAILGAPDRSAATLVAPEHAAGDDVALLTARIRDRAHDAGVLVEEIRAAKRGGALIRVEVAFSGSEKAVVALADTLERERVLLRFANWKMAPVAGGGVRLTGEAVAVRR